MMHTPCCIVWLTPSTLYMSCVQGDLHSNYCIYIQKEQRQNTTAKYDKLALENNVSGLENFQANNLLA